MQPKFTYIDATKLKTDKEHQNCFKLYFTPKVVRDADVDEHTSRPNN